MKTFWSKSKNHWSKSTLKGKEQRRPTEKKRNLNETPTTLPLSHGVPQGSILGPLLFNVYVNDLPTVPKACSVESYVDDSKLYLTFQSKDADLAMETMCENLKTVAAWFCFSTVLNCLEFKFSRERELRASDRGSSLKCKVKIANKWH